MSASSARAAPLPVVVTGDPVAPPLAGDGQGLCSRSAVSASVQVDFAGLTVPTYNAGINAFLDRPRMPSDPPELQIHEETLRTIFDLSNNNATGLKLSFGDFLDSAPGVASCQQGGCDLYKNDTFTPFATRFRGFLNVTDGLAGKPLHFGFYADDAVSLSIFDNKQTSYPVITRPPVLGAPTWRTTNTVTFQKAGIYPVEINYVEIVEHAALEMSIFQGAYTDSEAPANQMGSTSLKASGFQLMARAAFFQTVSGMDSVPGDPNACAQCNRQFAGVPGNGGCAPGNYCNEAALCAPCTTALFCGESCAPCGGASPFCINLNGKSVCVPCRSDGDCPGNKKCIPDTHKCEECEKESDCERGMICNPSHVCVPCSTSDSCAGVSCNCCPKSAPFCSPVEGQARPTCVECVSDADCKGRRCDPRDGRCVDEVVPCLTSDRCGNGCVRCPAERPFCVAHQPDVGRADAACAECRNDNDCATGRYCEAGDCVPCTTNRHCGSRCTGCKGDTPFCLLPRPQEGSGAEPVCVRCLEDGDCGGGRCDLRTHTCDSACAMTCAAGLVCDGSRCVACYTDSQCCGGSCDPITGTCEQSCVDSSDCLGTQHCLADERICKPGKRMPNTTVPPCSYGVCSVAPVGGRNVAGTRAALLLALCAGLALVARRRRR